PRGMRLGQAYWDWGVPTAASIAMLAPLGFETLIATGGVTSGLDIAKAVALGATLGGIARPVLQALRRGGAEGLGQYLDGIVEELRIAMLLTGSRDLAALRTCDRLISAPLSQYGAESRV
ncbi:MAG: type 2 isopentenyl-diphosphate Delta-isomerase, partial [Proteobacteria bacterium]